MKKAKVCHIVNWYPNKWNDKEALWVKAHIESLKGYFENEVIHVEVRDGKLGLHKYKISEHERAIILTTKIKKWFIIEFLTTILLTYVLLCKVDRKKKDLFNFHITYPLLTYSKFIGFLVKRPIVVTEHWSAYHFNFGVKKSLKRIQRIFNNSRLKFICVSNALKKDIEYFSKTKIDARIVPNIINEKVFNFKGESIVPNRIFMVSFWKSPKDPFVVFEACKAIKESGVHLKLIVGGFGPLLKEMEDWIKDNDMSGTIQMKGKMNSDEIAHEMNMAQIFVHNSNYEVASVVCMEAISCGCPVVASKVGGIVEYLDVENGVLVSENTVDNWSKDIRTCLNLEYDRESISKRAHDKFKIANVGRSYAIAINELIK